MRDVGENYIADAKIIEDYELDENKLPTNANGIVTENSIEVTYYYKKTKESIDKTPISPTIPSNPIIPETTINNYISISTKTSETYVSSQTPQTVKIIQSEQAIANSVTNTDTKTITRKEEIVQMSEKTPETGDNTVQITIKVMLVVIIANVLVNIKEYKDRNKRKHV